MNEMCVIPFSERCHIGRAFNIKSDTSQIYINPTSLVPGQEIGIFDAWHGEWMAEIIHPIVPEAKIIPIRERPAGNGKEESFIDCRCGCIDEKCK